MATKPKPRYWLLPPHLPCGQTQLIPQISFHFCGKIWTKINLQREGLFDLYYHIIADH